jgi:hypothetical protein
MHRHGGAYVREQCAQKLLVLVNNCLKVMELSELGVTGVRSGLEQEIKRMDEENKHIEQSKSISGGNKL